MKKYLWKSMKAGLKSSYGEIDWKIGKWYKIERPVSVCSNGFHACKRIIDAMNYISLEVLALVEVRGKHDSEGKKDAYEEMRIIKAYKWKQKDSVELSIYCAELCLSEFENVYKIDKSPRLAIEAAKAYLLNSTEENKQAAESAAESAAWSAWSAWSARSAAESAARSAWSASARSAWSAAELAARSAAWSARSAAESAAWSAWSAAKEKRFNQIENWLQNHIKYLEEYK